MLDEQTRDVLIAWLEWQAAMGVDAAVDAEAVDWTARPGEPPGHGFALPAAAGDNVAVGATVEPSRASRLAPSPPTPIPSPRGGGGRGGALGATVPTSTPGLPSPLRGGVGGEDERPADQGSRPALTAPPSTHSVQGLKPAGFDPTARPPAPRPFPTAAPDAAEASARRLAAGARSLAELQTLLAGFDGCALKATAKNLCFYRGAEQAPLMLIGEAPGREEDLEGKPFVGRAGQLLDKMLKAGGWSEADVHITNVVYWRPPGNRTPTPQEVQVCRPFLERQVELVQPRIVLLLGGAAAKAVLDIAEGIMRVRGKWQDVTIGGHAARAMATLHPAYLLRTPAAKRLAWRDLQAVREAVEAG